MSRANQYDAMAEYFRSMLNPAGLKKNQKQQHEHALSPIKQEAKPESKPVLERVPVEKSKLAKLLDDVQENAVLEPIVEVKTQTVQAEPVAEIKVETKVADPVAETTVETKVVEPVAEIKVETKISEPVAEIKVETKVAEPVAENKQAVVIPQREKTFAPAAEIADKTETKAEWTNIDVPDEFQALFFVANGITFAVPLIDLGSIANFEEPTPIFGKPEWFMGVLQVRDEKVSVIDWIKWAMPQSKVMGNAFQYIIRLGTSKWGITSDDLVGTQWMRREHVQWRSSAGMRPWLAGLVKEKKCALIHVPELIKLIEKGVDISGN